MAAAAVGDRRPPSSTRKISQKKTFQFSKLGSGRRGTESFSCWRERGGGNSAIVKQGGGMVEKSKGGTN